MHYTLYLSKRIFRSYHPKCNCLSERVICPFAFQLESRHLCNLSNLVQSHTNFFPYFNSSDNTFVIASFSLNLATTLDDDRHDFSSTNVSYDCTTRNAALSLTTKDYDDTDRWRYACSNLRI